MFTTNKADKMMSLAHKIKMSCRKTILVYLAVPESVPGCVQTVSVDPSSPDHPKM